MKLEAKLKKTTLATALAAVIGASVMAAPGTASATVVTFDYTGLFTMLTSAGNALVNTDYQYNSWGGNRTDITGTMTLDLATGMGTGTVVPFNFFNGGPAVAASINMQMIGNGMGGPGTLILGNMLFNWNGNNGIPVSIVLDGAGIINTIQTGLPTLGQVISGLGTFAASEGMAKGSYAMGLLPIVTTTWNTTTVPGTTFGTNPSGQLPLIADSGLVTNYDVNPLLPGYQSCLDQSTASGNQCALGIGGTPMQTAPFPGYNANFDISSLTVTSISAVPIPAAVWLFGSGLLGLVGIAKRKRIKSI